MLTRLLAVLSALAGIVQLAMGALGFLVGLAMVYPAIREATQTPEQLGLPYKDYAGAAVATLAMGVHLLLIGAFQLSAVLQLLEIPGRVPPAVRTLSRLAAAGALVAIVGVGMWSRLDTPQHIAIAVTVAGIAAAIIALALPKPPWSGAWFAACLLAVALMPVLPLAFSQELGAALGPFLGGGALLSIGFIAAARPAPPEEPDAE